MRFAENMKTENIVKQIVKISGLTSDKSINETKLLLKELCIRYNLQLVEEDRYIKLRSSLIVMCDGYSVSPDETVKMGEVAKDFLAIIDENPLEGVFITNAHGECISKLNKFKALSKEVFG